jgi:hypothetical protein
MTPNKQIVENFQQLYNTLNRETLTFERLTEVYSDDIIFEDCFHHIEGIDSLFEYFDNLYENVRYIHFDFENHWISDESAMLTWTMSYQHPKLNGGETIAVKGASQLNFKQGKVVRHRDYFDGGALLYEHIPILKRIILFLKNRLA